MKNIIKQAFQILKRPFFIILLLFYYIGIFVIKILFPLFSSILNIFTLVLIPITLAVIYIIWNIFYNKNIGDEMFDDEIREKYFNVINSRDKKNIEKLMETREEIEKLANKSHLNPSKQSLIDKLYTLNFNDMIQKYASNSIKIKFIEDFLNKKADKLSSIKDKLKNLEQAKNRYEKLNNDINNIFENIQAQGVLILTDDISGDMYSKDTIEDVMEKVKNIETTNSEINKFYVAIHKGKDYE